MANFDLQLHRLSATYKVRLCAKWSSKQQQQTSCVSYIIQRMLFYRVDVLSACIGVARILSGGGALFLHQKSDDLFSVVTLFYIAIYVLYCHQLPFFVSSAGVHLHQLHLPRLRLCLPVNVSVTREALIPVKDGRWLGMFVFSFLPASRNSCLLLSHISSYLLRPAVNFLSNALRTVLDIFVFCRCLFVYM